MIVFDYGDGIKRFKIDFEKFNGKENFTLWQQRIKNLLVQQRIYKILVRKRSKRISAED